MYAFVRSSLPPYAAWAKMSNSASKFFQFSATLPSKDKGSGLPKAPMLIYQKEPVPLNHILEQPLDHAFRWTERYISEYAETELSNCRVEWNVPRKSTSVTYLADLKRSQKEGGEGGGGGRVTSDTM